MIAQPTTCWTIDWDDLESNEQTFRALCHTLVSKELAMIGVLEAIVGKKVPWTRNQLEEKPRGSFIFLPAKNGTLLVKSLAVKELLLPYQTSPRLDTPSEKSLARVNESLHKIINPEHLVGKQNVSNFGNASRLKGNEGKKEVAADAKVIRGSKVKLYTPFPTSL
ncbi:hypothetical protein ACJMK2_019586 [Sinanodonta woodiana]|uniref:Uncharacterized protein n=1 Tax=Sinanodonta woodiana TaxID=1069815 RepID=A0ABD3TXL6_SINWO